jgi:hypothetical protein
MIGDLLRSGSIRISGSLPDGFLEELAVDGRPFRALVQHHLRRQDYPALVSALAGTVEMVRNEPARLQRVAEAMIDVINAWASTKVFWTTSVGDVASQVFIESAYLASLGDSGIECSDEYLFNILQIAVLNFAQRSHEDRSFRRLAGLR